MGQLDSNFELPNLKLTLVTQIPCARMLIFAVAVSLRYRHQLVVALRRVGVVLTDQSSPLTCISLNMQKIRQIVNNQRLCLRLKVLNYRLKQSTILLTNQEYYTANV